MSAHKCKIPYNRPRWIATDTAGDTLKSQPASLFNTGPHSRGTMMIGKIYISNKNAKVPGIRRGFLRIVTAPKSAGILGNPKSSVSGSPTKRSSRTATRMPQNQASRGT